MLRIVCLLLLLTTVSSIALPRGGAPPPGAAFITVNNFNGLGTSIGDQISHYDVSQNRIDAHAGMILQVGSTFYQYGESYGCGFVWQSSSPFCGFKVYSSTDLLNWTDQGFLFDGTTSFWQTRCAGNSGTGDGGCFRGHMIYNAANNDYVFWFNQAANASSPAPDSYFVFVCSSPTGGCVKQTDPSGLAFGTDNGDYAIYVDVGGTAYIAYSHNLNHIYTQALNANYTDGTGSATDTGATGEGVAMFSRAGTAYVLYGNLCGYCTGVDTSYVSASSFLGTYGAITTLNSNSCGGQERSVDVITANGQITYLYSSDQWTGEYNEARANIYYQPLSFTGSAINTFPCATSVTVAGLTQQNPTPPVTDQTSVALDRYNDSKLTNALWRMQTFVPTQTTLDHVIMPLGQTCNGSNVCTPAGLGGNLTVLLTTLDGSHNPVTTLASVVLTNSDLSWSQTAISLPLTVSGLSAGTPYGLVVQVSGTQNGGSVALQDGTAPNTYPSGVERYSTDGGSTWTSETGAALMFSTYP